MAEAQAALRAMLAAGNDDGLVAMDLATLLQQDGKPAEAVAVFEKAAKPDPPDYALLAVDARLSRSRPLRRCGAAGARGRAPLSRRERVAAAAVAGAERRRPHREALEVLRTPAAARAPPVERLLAEGYAWRAGNPGRRAQGLYRGGAAVARQSRRAQRGGRRPARHGRALRRRGDRRERRGRSRRNRLPRWCAGARRPGRPTRRAASTAPTRRSRGSMRCWPRCRRTTRRCAGACGSTAWWPCAIACAWRRRWRKATRSAPTARCPPMPRRPMPMRCSTCGGRRRRATPTAASWRSRPRTCSRALWRVLRLRRARGFHAPTPPSTRWSTTSRSGATIATTRRATPIPTAPMPR